MFRNGLVKIVKLPHRLNWKCKMCGKMSFKGNAYEWTSPAYHLTKTIMEPICAKCARRELGTKNKKGWDKIHEKS